MDSVGRDSTGPLAEIKPDREGGITASPPYADAKPRGATVGAIVYPNAAECLTFESAPRSGSFRCVETFERKRIRAVLRAREEPIEVAIVDADAETRFFLRRILEQSVGYRYVGSYSSGEEALRRRFISFSTEFS